jgi:fused signal recognition particle receptor
MFGFLKDKLKSWVNKAKDSFSSKAKETKEEEIRVKSKKEKKAKKKEEQIKEIEVKKNLGASGKEKKIRTSEELKSERETTEKIKEDIHTEKLEIKSPEEKFEEQIAEKELKETEAEAEQKEQEIEEKEEEKPEKQEKKGFFSRLRSIFVYKVTEEDFEEIFQELEMSLLESNIALEVVEELKKKLKQELIDKEIKKSEIEGKITESLKKSLEEILINPEDLIKQIKEHKKNSQEPFKLLFFGINGAGKTTSIAKICHLLQKNKFSVVLAAADTFRAASIEQLQVHADKLNVHMIKHDYNSDPSAVAFDAIKYAKQNKIDVVLVDTAGRMHTKENLLKEMEKICRVTQPNLKVFVAEAIAGNDATEQAKAFNEIIGIDGSILSKTDVDEKGGTIVSISFITKKPILFLGTGQTYDDLELFNKDKFIERLGL